MTRPPEPPLAETPLESIAGRVGKLGGWVVSLTSQLPTWSDETAAIHEEPAGFSPLTVESALAYYTPKDRGPLSRALEACASQGVPFDADFEITTAKGRHIWVRSIGEAVRNSAGEITHVQGACQDISEQKLAAELAQTRASRLQELLETISDAFFTLDRDWCFTYLNGEAERLLSRERTQLLGRNIWDEFSAAVGTASEREYRRAMTEGLTGRFEQFYPPLNRWFNVEAHPTREGIAVYFRDITERRREAEARVAKLEGNYKNLLEAAPDAMVVVNARGEIVVLNTEMEKLFGYPREELLGKPIELLVPSRYRERHAHQRAAFVAQGHTRSLGNRADLCGLSKEGREFPVEIMLSPLESAEGTLTTAAIRDISVRKAAERQLALMEGRCRGLLHAAPDAMILLNQAEEIVLVNLQAERQLGYSAAELVGQRVTTVIPGGLGDTPSLEQPIAADDLPLPRLRAELEGNARHKDGREFPAELSLARLDSAEGPLLTVAIRDISARRKAEAQLLETLQELKRSNEELGQFAYIASHDLQEPLRMVASYTQLLSKRYKGKLDPDADEFIAFAVDGANRMQRLIQDLLAYSRIASKGKDMLETSSEAAVEQALSNLAAAIVERGAVITHDPLPPVLADAGQLIQLFQNLLGNAIKYQAAGVPQIHVSCVKAEESKWRFAVADNGLGIEPRYFERIFGMFQRLHGRDEFEGTGIGLALCKRIVERHGGRIWVESAPGKGATFYFTLPDSQH